MDNKRAAIVTSAGVGLLISALVLHKWTRKRREHEPETVAKAVVHSDNGHRRARNHALDAL